MSDKPKREEKTFDEEISLMSSEDYSSLKWLYEQIQNDPGLLLTLAMDKGIGIDEAYAACRQKILFYDSLMEKKND